jgi:hypothetical protein
MQTLITGIGRETDQRPKGNITTAMNQSLQHLLLQRLKTCFTKRFPNKSDAFGKDWMVLKHCTIINPCRSI